LSEGAKFLLLLAFAKLGLAGRSCRSGMAAPTRAGKPSMMGCSIERSPAASTVKSKEEKPMPFYLTRFSYTPATWAKLMKNPEDRREAARQYIESVGGKLHGFWYAFGDHDGYNLWEAPDNVSMAATALAIGAGGALSSIQTTVLMTVDETLAALKKASSIKYQPPGDKG
jgi:uncharacterized protein with GYD domain